MCSKGQFRDKAKLAEIITKPYWLLVIQVYNAAIDYFTYAPQTVIGVIKDGLFVMK